jgi:hypothetical protein
MNLAHLLNLSRDIRQPCTVQPSHTEQVPSRGEPFRHTGQNCNEQQDGARRKLLEVLDQALAMLAEECDDQDDDD